MDTEVLRSLSWDGVRTWLLGDGLRILVILAVAVVLRWLAHRFITRVVRVTTDRIARDHGGLERHLARTRTMGALLRSVITFAVAAVALITILGLIGIPLAPLLASAGVGGVALGFGAQSLVKDFLAGIFMILEDQYGVGDVIDTGEAVGTVEDVTLRVTKIRDANGVAWYVRNGEIVRVGNKSQGWSTAIVDVAIAYTESVEQALPVIRSAAEAMHADPAWATLMIDAPEVVGIESMSGASVTIRTIVKCHTQQNLPVQRELRERIKRALDDAGVKAPPAVLPFGGPRP
ncbi:MAG: mechanosensitive ion channel family protein [Nostocoides sp.]